MIQIPKIELIYAIVEGADTAGIGVAMGIWMALRNWDKLEITPWRDTGENVAMLTLVTCENNGTQRLIVRCVIK